MAEVQAETRRALLDLLAGRFDAAAVELVGAGDRQDEEVGAEVELAVEKAGIGVVDDPEDAAEEGVQLAFLAADVEIEVVDAGERQGVVERIVVEHAAEQEEPVAVEALLDRALAGRLVLHQVAEALVGVAHHGRLRGQDLVAALIELGPLMRTCDRRTSFSTTVAVLSTERICCPVTLSGRK